MRKTEGSPLPFGAAAKERKVNFSVQVPMGKTCELLLYREGNTKPEVCFDMPEEEGIGEVRFLSVEEIDPEKYEYNFLIDGKVCTDPYAKEIAGREVFGKRQNDDKHGVRAKIQVSDYDWGEDRPIRHPWNEVVSYSIHVRGFTKHSSSKVLHRGTYQGVIEKIPYLKELGVNQIQCMPIYEFDECAKTKINYWGYGPAFYFAPKEAYSSDGCAVRELKDMVKACHKADIEVVLEMPFAAGISEQEAAECLRFYMMEYHVDGFVVNPYIVSWELLNKDPFLKGIRLMRKDDGFQNVMRRFLKGDENMLGEFAAISRKNETNSASINYIANNNGFTLNDLVSYDRKHNELNGENNRDGEDFNFSWNCGEEGSTRKRKIKELRMRQIKNALAFVFLSAGTPLILAGDEFGNSQNGNNNPYCVDSELSWVNWKETKEGKEILEWTKALIQFRQNNKILHMPQSLTLSDRVSCGYPDISYHGTNAWYAQMNTYDRHLGIMYSCVYGDEEDHSLIYAAYNMHWENHSFALPKINGTWKVDMSSNVSGAVIDDNNRSVCVEPRSVAILTGTYEIPAKKEK